MNIIKKHKILKKLIIIFCCLILTATALFFAIHAHIEQLTKNYIVDIDTAPQSDAVMVLGARVYNNGEPSAILTDRLEYAYEMYKNKKAKKILVSGDHGQADYDEANGMKDYLLKKGVPREDIFLDHAGFNTYDSMYRAKEIFCIKTMIISTQEFHINRSIYIARGMGIDAYGYPSDDKSMYGMKRLNLRETFAKIKAFIDVEITKRKPKFLGDPIPIDGDGILTDG